MSVIPTQALLDERSSHQLHYVNDRRFDYAFRKLQFIPTCLEIWSEFGVDLSGGLIDYLWREYADKRPGNESGERNRASKLALDALREVFTMTAIGIAHNAVIRYSAADDMSGRDFKMIMQTGHQHWVQFRVQNSPNDYLQTKEIRRSDRGVSDSKPILLTALSAMIGAATILLDPIFQGLAISLLFGLASSTLLTVLVIPAIYVVLRDADVPA